MHRVKSWNWYIMFKHWRQNICMSLQNISLMCKGLKIFCFIILIMVLVFMINMEQDWWVRKTRSTKVGQYSSTLWPGWTIHLLLLYISVSPSPPQSCFRKPQGILIAFLVILSFGGYPLNKCFIRQIELSHMVKHLDQLSGHFLGCLG